MRVRRKEPGGDRLDWRGGVKIYVAASLVEGERDEAIMRVQFKVRGNVPASVIGDGAAPDQM